LNKHVGHAYARAPLAFFFLSRRETARFALFRARFVADRITRSSRAPGEVEAQFHTREPVWTRRRTRRDSHHVRPRLGCVSRFDARVSRITARRDAARGDAERRAMPVAAANFAFLARLKSASPDAVAAAGPSSRRRASL
jgi:hypothetical protein